ncbi:carbohydrate ABC transporter permease [Arthrobacter sp. SD76]|uniref:carbohydrate ABC transporter permease n=1 Tax=Arthrobacter sp. SD76 TaxID=3415007 RepID=UPI003C785E1E
MFNRYGPTTLVREVIVIAVALVMLLPFYLLVVMAFKDKQEAVTSSPVALPEAPTLDNFITVFTGSGSRSVLLGLFNSAIITACSLVLLIALGSIAAYVIARRAGRVSNSAYIFFVVGIILPFQLGMIPAYVALRSTHLVGTHFGMILLYAGLLLPLSVFLYTATARTIPLEYEEAASIDGASKLRVFTTVVFPLLSPATGTVAILAGLVIWNDFFTSLIFLSGSKATTIPVVMYSFVGENVTEWNLVFAVVIVSMIPILAFYLLAQKKFIQGFAGGLKG